MFHVNGINRFEFPELQSFKDKKQACTLGCGETRALKVKMPLLMSLPCLFSPPPKNLNSVVPDSGPLWLQQHLGTGEACLTQQSALVSTGGGALGRTGSAVKIPVRYFPEQTIGTEETHVLHIFKFGETASTLRDVPKSHTKN